MQIFIFNIHNKAVYIDKIVVTFARIFTLISKQITAVGIPCIKPGLFFYFTKYCLEGLFTCLCSSAGNLPASRCPCFRHDSFRDQKFVIRTRHHTKYRQVVFPVLQAPVVTFHCTACWLLISIINVPVFHFLSPC